MNNNNVPGSNQNVNVQVRTLTTDPNVTSQYKTKILHKNVVNGVNTLTQAMINDTNTKYVIKYDYVLGENITVPTGCILEFDGGSVSGAYTLTGSNTQIIAEESVIFKNSITIAGTWNIPTIYVSWFDDTNVTNFYDICRNVCNLTDSNIVNNIYVNKNIYWAPTQENDTLFPLKSNTNLYLDNNSITVNKNNYAGYRCIAVNRPNKYVNIFGGIIIGDVQNHDISDAGHYQYGHGIVLFGAKYVTIKNTKAYNLRGDGIDITEYDPSSFGKFDYGSEHIVVDNVICDYSGRNGLSIPGSIRDVRIINSTFSNTGQHNTTTANPGFGIDIEPTHVDTVSIYDLLIDNCCFINNLSTDLYVIESRDTRTLKLSNLSVNGDIILSGSFKNVTIENCNCTRILFSINSGVNPNNLDNIIYVNNCRIKNNINSGNYNHTMYHIFYNNCDFIDTAEVTVIPFNIQAAHELRFNSCRLYYPNLNNVSLFSIIGSAPIYFTNCHIETNGVLGGVNGINEFVNCYIKADGFLDYNLSKDKYIFVGNYIEISNTTKNFDFYTGRTALTEIYLINNYIKNAAQSALNGRYYSLSGNKEQVKIIDINNNFYINSPDMFKNTCLYLNSNTKLEQNSIVIYSGYIDIVKNNIAVGAFVFDPDKKKLMSYDGTNIIESDGATAYVNRSGTFANKPAASNIYIGFKYFCTDKQTTEGATDGIEIIHKGNDVWVDALGRIVS